MLEFREFFAKNCLYESTYHLLKICPFRITRKMTVLSIVNRGRKILCPIISKRLSYLRFEETIIPSFQKDRAASFRNDSFAYDYSKINLRVISK